MLRKLKNKIKFALIIPGIPWKDELFEKDLARWKSVLNMKGTDKQILSKLLSSDKAFRSLYIFRLKNAYTEDGYIFYFRRSIHCT